MNPLKRAWLFHLRRRQVPRTVLALRGGLFITEGQVIFLAVAIASGGLLVPLLGMGGSIAVAAAGFLAG